MIVDINIPFNQGTPTIEILKPSYGSIKVGNNVNVVRNLTPFTEVFETNKLVIYNQEGTTLRGTYYGTTDGITTNASNPLRLPVIKTTFIFNTDDSLDDIKNDNLQEQMLNHKITFDLILDNSIYSFYEWKLGMPIDVWYNGQYFQTDYTGYSMIKNENENLGSVQITCGKVRNKLTEILNGYK